MSRTSMGSIASEGMLHSGNWPQGPMSILHWAGGGLACVRGVFAFNAFFSWSLGCLFPQLVSATCKDLSMLSVTPSLASATVSRGCTRGSVTAAYPGTGAFQAASPASATAMQMTATQWQGNAWAARTTPRGITVKGTRSLLKVKRMRLFLAEQTAS